MARQKVKDNKKREKGCKRGGRGLYFLRSLWLFLPALLFFLYYLTAMLFGGAGTSILWIWPCASFALAAMGVCVLFFGEIPHKHPLSVAVIIVIMSLVISFLIVEGFIVAHMGSTAPDGVECIIVLGAAVKGERPSVALRERILTAYDYLKNNPDTVAVLSGGQGKGENISEAECMRRELTSRGIDDSRLILEDESTSTSENIKNSLAIIGDRYSSIAVLTNNFHVYRALRLVSAQTDIKTYAISAPFRNPLVLHYMVREFIGLGNDTLRGNF